MADTLTREVRRAAEQVKQAIAVWRRLREEHGLADGAVLDAEHRAALTRLATDRLAAALATDLPEVWDGLTPQQREQLLTGVTWELNDHSVSLPAKIRNSGAADELRVLGESWKQHSALLRQIPTLIRQEQQSKVHELSEQMRVVEEAEQALIAQVRSGELSELPAGDLARMMVLDRA